MKTAIYSRFSTDRQSESSIADQELVCAEFAQRQGWQVTERYSDAGISGAAFGNRPGFLRMRADAMAGHIDTLLVTDTSRLARSQELAPLIERFRFQRVRVLGVLDSFDSQAGTADMQAGMSGMMSVEFRKMIKSRTHSALKIRALSKRATGGKTYGYTSKGEIVPAQARVVREIFERFAAGASCRTIAAELNARGVASPGAGWRRTERRSGGWMQSTIRPLLMCERYIGRVIWNRTEWMKDPDSGKRVPRSRPQSEWIIQECPRIVSDGLWEAAVDRLKPMPNDTRLKAGGRVRYLLSGLLRCDVCGSHYVMGDARAYACSGFVNGRACKNEIRVRRDHAEQVLLGPIRDGLLAPARVKMVAAEMDAFVREQLRARAERSTGAPAELSALDERIARLRERQRRGDPDMSADELQVAIERAEGKRRALVVPDDSNVSYDLLARLPEYAALYRQELTGALNGDPEAADNARVLLRGLFSGGEIRLQPQPDGGLLALWKLQPAALFLRAAGSAGTSGSGGVLPTTARGCQTPGAARVHSGLTVEATKTRYPWPGLLLRSQNGPNSSAANPARLPMIISKLQAGSTS